MMFLIPMTGHAAEPTEPTLNSCGSLVDQLSPGDYTSTVKDGKEITRITNPEILQNFVEKNKFEGLEPGKQVKEITYVRDIPNKSNYGIGDNVVTPDWNTGWYINNLRSTSACTSERIATTAGNSGMLKLAVTESVSATYNTEVGISVEIINAKVGFNVTKSYTIMQENQVDTKGKHTRINAYAEYDGYSFDIRHDGIFKDTLEGRGTALKPVGVCFVTIQ
jgi:hypothetical protein